MFNIEKEITIGSLFSGIGGIELGFERQGFKTKWFVENNPYAKEILKKRFPNTYIYGDITKIDFKSIPKVDILTGGFPCQDISNAGKRAGIEGSRSSLWKYYLKAIGEIRPKVAFIENVSALLNRGLDTVLTDLASVGYDAEWYCVPASSVGAWHKRDRVFIISYPTNIGLQNKTNEQVLEGKGRGEFQLGKSRNIDVSYPNEHRSEIDKRTDKEEAEEIWWKEEGDVSDKRGEDVSDTNINGSFRKDIDTEEGRRDVIGSEGKDVPDTNPAGQQDWSEQHRGKQAQNGKGEFRIGRQDIVSPDVSDTKQGVIQEHECRSGILEEEDRRRKTTRFINGIDETRGYWSAEPRLGRVANGIPNRVDRIKCIGNAVVPQVAEVFAKTIKEKLRG